MQRNSSALLCREHNRAWRQNQNCRSGLIRWHGLNSVERGRHVVTVGARSDTRIRKGESRRRRRVDLRKRRCTRTGSREPVNVVGQPGISGSIRGSTPGQHNAVSCPSWRLPNFHTRWHFHHDGVQRPFRKRLGQDGGAIARAGRGCLRQAKCKDH